MLHILNTLYARCTLPGLPLRLLYSCCAGLDSTYKIVVSRSLNVNGPYVDKQGTLATAGGGSIGKCQIAPADPYETCH